MHSNGEKLLSHPKTHTFKENSFSPLNQRNATIKELQARFLATMQFVSEHTSFHAELSAFLQIFFFFLDAMKRQT